jgi:eukaryotic-like serine/threonine-protein kinase
MIQPPCTIGQYQIQRLIGRGGIARVYLADHPTYGQVALKVLLPSFGRNHEANWRFRMEAQLLKRMRHPNILRLYEASAWRLADDARQPFIATEYLPDGSLYDLLQRCGGKVREDYMLLLAVQVADALIYAHTRGIIHRDIKPSNILLREEHAVLCDFSVARTLTEATITQQDRVMGTLAYMSPEQTLGGHRFVRRGSDIYSFGVVLYEMLSGYQPRRDPTLDDLRVTRMIQQHPLPSLSQIAPWVTPAVADVVYRCIQPRRSHRYDSMESVAAALRHAAAAQGYRVPPAPIRAHTWFSPRSPSFKLLGSVGAVLLLIAVFILLLITHR